LCVGLKTGAGEQEQNGHDDGSDAFHRLCLHSHT
jgi:hypothetical protein